MFLVKERLQNKLIPVAGSEGGQGRDHIHQTTLAKAGL